MPQAIARVASDVISIVSSARCSDPEAPWLPYRNAAPPDSLQGHHARPPETLTATQARRRRTTIPRAARPTASSVSDAGLGAGKMVLSYLSGPYEHPAGPLNAA
jgi:hypothetical protein